jgi:RNA polymerase sigma factor (sigma-70 family)
MSPVTNRTVVRQIGSLFDGGSVAGLTDRQLIERFTAARDAVGEAAFAALVRRHGPMVLDICRQLLGDLHDAEDAFQAVFLVLARKARSIGDPDLLGNWLYGVALRTAKKARVRRARRRRNEEFGSIRYHGSGSCILNEQSVRPAEQTILAREDAEILHCEIDRLPRPFRLPILLYYFEGLTLDEAAQRLRCPAGTVRSRLARACAKLRRGLTRRGVALSGAGLVAPLSSRSAAASISSHLCDITTQAAIQFAAGQADSSMVVSLAHEVLRAMLIHKLRFTIVALLILAAFATGAAFLTLSLARTDEPKKTPAAAQPPLVAKPDDLAKAPAQGRMFVVGRVLDPQGKPVPYAKVMVHARVKQFGDAFGIEAFYPAVIGDADADGSGQFRLGAPRTASSRNDELMALALAPGFGVGWAALDPDADRPGADIRLNPEQVIQGRLFDLQGRPAQGVTVSVSRALRILVRDSEPSDPQRFRFEGPNYWWARVYDWPAWPKPATTDADGRFSIHGVGRGLQASLSIIDSRFALQTIEVETDNSPNAKSATMALRPAQIITGRVNFADTGKPVPHAHLIVNARGGGQSGTRPTYFETDADGRFRANPSPGDQFIVNAAPPAGQPYLGASKRFEWPKGAIEHSLDLSLPRGVLIRGKVTEEGSDRPIAGAAVVFLAHLSVNDSGREGGGTKTLADGSFEVVGPPRPGHLAVHSLSADYVFQEIGDREFQQGLPGGTRLYSHAFIACEPKPGGTGPAVNVFLRRGVTVTGRIVAPDDQPVPDTWIISRIALGPSGSAWGVWRGNYHGNAHNGRFELHGLNPAADVPVHFLEPKRKLGATVLLPRQAVTGEPLTVRLQPCGTAQARLVDTKGQPVAGYRAQYLILMTVTPGSFRGSRDPADANRPFADADYLTRIDSINYRNEPTSDAQGRIEFPALIPGATYRISNRSQAGQASRPPLQQNFTVKPGETIDLGDIVVEKPAA